MKTNAIIQARTGSTRLPNKILMDLCGKPILWHVIERLKAVKQIDEVIVATTDLKGDDGVYDECKKWGVSCVRGDSGNVLSRYYKAYSEYPCDVIIRVTADCPMIDPGVCDALISFFKSNNYRYASTIDPDPEKRTFPRGLDCEIFEAALLKEAYENANEDYEKEHVTPYMYWKNKSIGHFVNEGKNYSHLRWTVDTPEDYELIKSIYEAVYPTNPLFSWTDIITAYDTHSEWLLVNKDVEQKHTR
jgi:spore coat polysaccharide biosynthesis protein SpsF